MKQLIQYFIAILLWIAAIALWISGVTFWFFLVLVILHFMELLIIGYRTGLKFGVSKIRSIIFCLLFGYLWWLPILNNIKEDEPMEQDYIEDDQEPWREKVIS